MKRVKILILEDNLMTLYKIFEVLLKLTQLDISVVVLSEYTQVDKFINNTDETFDLILLDRDCYLGGSFHILDIEKTGPDKIIAISSVPDYNQDAIKRGVTLVIDKDYGQLDEFANNLIIEIRKFFDNQ